ncbi:hypothetical protein ACTXT7_000739, partial [Hymenolepis weldensis]
MRNSFSCERKLLEIKKSIYWKYTCTHGLTRGLAQVTHKLPLCFHIRTRRHTLVIHLLLRYPLIAFASYLALARLNLHR